MEMKKAMPREESKYYGFGKGLKKKKSKKLSEKEKMQNKFDQQSRKVDNNKESKKTHEEDIEKIKYEYEIKLKEIQNMK